VWHGRIVSESTLSTRINAARSAIGDSGEEQRLIRTAHGKGIRFIGAVREQEETVRKLAAIFAADVAGYSRLMAQDEVGTLRRLTACRVILDEHIAAHRGRIFGSAGDSVVADFASAIDAVQCAVAVQDAVAQDGPTRSTDQPMRLRIGVHVGDVIVQGDNLFGDAVNIAARLEALAEPGGICISGAVHDQIGTKLPIRFSDLGEQQAKNIAEPIRAYSTGKGSTTAVAAPALLLPDKPSVARLSIVVLPVNNLSNDPDQEYFADGITDDLTTDLSRISGSFVIARTTAFTYKGKPIDTKQIGRELGVRYVLEGSVRRTGDQIRVNAQLIDAESGAHLWAERFDTNRTNLTEAQNEITRRLAWALNLELLSDAGRRIERENAVDPDARDLVMRGFARWYRPASVTSGQEALFAFERALEIDPRSTDARIGIAMVLVGTLANGWSSSSFQRDATRKDVARAERLLCEVIERDSNRSSAYVIIGLLRRMQSRLNESRMALEEAITLDPNNEWAYRQLSWTLLFLGEPADATALGEKSLRLSPRDPNIFWVY
jgi:TolB-like protein